MNTTLSPAAAAVLDAFLDTPGEVPMPMWDYGRDLAAALRSAADQVVPPDPCGDDCCIDLAVKIRADFLAIAAELDANAQ